MAQRRVEVKSFETGERGEAVLVKVSDTKARVEFLESGNKYEVSVKQGAYDDETTTIPEHVPFKKMKVGSTLRLSATMTQDGKRLLYASPWSGELQVKFVGFKAKEGEAPVPEEKVGKQNKPYRIFTPILEVVSGTWKGLQYRNNNLYDKFVAHEDGMMAIGGSSESANNLSDFLDCIGVDISTIPFSENPLPEIQELALEANKEFSVIIVKGWIATYVAGLDVDSDDYVDEEIPTEGNGILAD
jgi:hypothetical protein